jgi:hypothetical protein
MELFHVVDMELDMERRLIKGLVVKVEEKGAKKAWTGKLHLPSAKILIAAEIIAGRERRGLAST